MLGFQPTLASPDPPPCVVGLQPLKAHTFESRSTHPGSAPRGLGQLGGAGVAVDHLVGDAESAGVGGAIGRGLLVAARGRQPGPAAEAVGRLRRPDRRGLARGMTAGARARGRSGAAICRQVAGAARAQSGRACCASAALSESVAHQVVAAVSRLHLDSGEPRASSGSVECGAVYACRQGQGKARRSTTQGTRGGALGTRHKAHASRRDTGVSSV
jgi:hypothetical protein